MQKKIEGRHCEPIWNYKNDIRDKAIAKNKNKSIKTIFEIKDILNLSSNLKPAMIYLH